MVIPNKEQIGKDRGSKVAIEFASVGFIERGCNLQVWFKVV